MAAAGEFDDTAADELRTMLAFYEAMRASGAGHQAQEAHDVPPL